MIDYVVAVVAGSVVDVDMLSEMLSVAVLVVATETVADLVEFGVAALEIGQHCTAIDQVQFVDRR